MALTNEQQQIAERIAHLLAESPLDEEIKQTILEGMDKLPKYLIFRLKDALEMEREELKRVVFDIELFLKDQEDAWQKVEAEQRAITDKLVDKYAQKIEDEIKLKQARDSLKP